MNTSDIPFQQIKYLDILFDIAKHTNKKKVSIKIREGATPTGEDYDLYNWLNYQQIKHKIKEPIYTAGTLQNEIVFDPDISDWQLMRQEMNKVLDFLNIEKIPYQLAYSGGKSIHLHIFIGKISFDAEIIDNKNTFDFDIFKTVRTELMNIIFKESGANRDIIGLDLPKITFSKDKKGSMVRFYGTTRADGHFKTLIQTIPETKEAAQKLKLIFPDKIEVWNVPEKFSKIVNDSIKLNISKAKEDNHVKFENMILDGTVLKKFPCMKEILGKDGIIAKDGQRYYTGQAIMLLGRKCGKSYPECSEILKEYYGRCQKYDSTFTDAAIKLRVDNLKTEYESNDQFSCRKFKEKVSFGINVCNYPKCPIKKHVDRTIKKDEQKTATTETIDIPQEKLTWIKQESDRMLGEGSAFDHLMTTYSRLHVGDTITGKSMFVAQGAQACKNTSGLQTKISANSGMGKTHSAMVVMHQTPQEYLLDSSLTPKVLFRMNIKPGMILYSDDVEPNEDLQEVIKRSSTNFQKETHHTYLANDEVCFGTIPPRVNWLLTSVNDNGSMEYLNRQLNLGVDESTDQDDKVFNGQVKKAMTGEDELPINDDVLISREILRDIKKHLFTVIVPFADKIVWEMDKHNRRNFSQFLDIIRGFSVFNYRNRKHIDENTIEATEKDFEDAVKMYGARAVNQRLKLNDNEISIIKKMEQGISYYIEQIQEKTDLPYMTVYRAFHGRDNSSSGGLLHKVKGLMYAPETEFLGKTEVSDDKWETEHMVMKKTKPKHVYILKNKALAIESLAGYGKVASLNKGE